MAFKNLLQIKLLVVLLFTITLNAQKNPTLIIDGVAISFESNTSLPYWINEGKTIDLGVHAITVSILEFNIVENELQFNQVINLTASAIVPASKVWKIEAIGIGLSPNDSGIPTNGFSTSQSPSIFTSPQTFTSSGSWIVPSGVTSICIEAWGKGGDGGNSDENENLYKRGGGGGGGAYGYDCFSVTPGTSLNITINGAGSSVNDLIFAAAGQNGNNASAGTNGDGGLGGTSTAAYNISGSDGNIGADGNGGGGANGGNGGQGIQGCTRSNDGEFPGGGGGGGYGYPTCNSGGYTYPKYGGDGGGGQIIIYF